MECDEPYLGKSADARFTGWDRNARASWGLRPRLYAFTCFAGYGHAFGVHLMKKYPDVTELFKQKAQRRKRLVRLSFEEKIAIVNKWRKLTRSIRKSAGILPATAKRSFAGTLKNKRVGKA